MAKRKPNKYDDKTTLNVNREKLDLAMAKGIVIQDLLDNALDIALGYNTAVDKALELTKLERKLKDLKEEKEDTILKYDNRINILNGQITSLSKAVAKEEEESKEKELKIMFSRIVNASLNLSDEEIGEKFEDDILKYMELTGLSMEEFNEKLNDELEIKRNKF